MCVLHRLIIGTVFLALTLNVAPSMAAEEQGAKAAGKASVSTSSSGVGTKGSAPTLEVPSLLRLVPRESEADKLKGMAQFIKENRPRFFVNTFLKSPKSRAAFCGRFLEDLIQMRDIEAIEPDFVTGSEVEVQDKLKLKHCADLEFQSIVPPGVNPDLYLRKSYGFNYVSDIGGPPYRFYNISPTT